MKLAQTDQGVYAKHYREDVADLLAVCNELGARLDALKAEGITCEPIAQLAIMDEKERSLYNGAKYLIQVKKK